MEEESVLIDAFLKEEPLNLDLSAFLVDEKEKKRPSNSSKLEKSFPNKEAAAAPTLSSSGDQIRAFTALCNRLALNNPLFFSSSAAREKIESSPMFPPQEGASSEFSAIRQKIDHKNYAYQPKRQ